MSFTILQKSRNQFISEIEAGDYYWRTGRLLTTVDMVYMSLAKYILNPNEIHLVELINNCLKSLIIYEIGTTKIESFNLARINEEIFREKSKMIDLYDSYSSQIATSGITYNTSLQDEKIYLKILNTLKGSDYPKKTISQIVEIAYNI